MRIFGWHLVSILAIIRTRESSFKIVSPTSKSCHQHILSPTSVTNIDVTYFEVDSIPDSVQNGLVFFPNHCPMQKYDEKFWTILTRVLKIPKILFILVFPVKFLREKVSLLTVYTRISCGNILKLSIVTFPILGDLILIKMKKFDINPNNREIWTWKGLWT